jgi:Tol biopolymer transport system component
MPGRSVFLVVTGLLILSCSRDPTGTGVDEAPGMPASAKPGSPPAAPANPEIAWSNDGIWVMNADGSNQARVTPRGAWLGNPTWSPIVGSSPSYQFAYVNVGQDTVWAVDVTIVAGVPKGSIPRALATPAADPAWSPLGDEIAYVRTGAPGGIGIWVTNAAGTVHTPVHQPPASDSVTFMRPAWRSDGLALAFWEDRNPASPGHKKLQVVTRASPTASWSTPTTVYLDPNPSAGNALDWARTKNVLVFTAGQSNAAIELLDLDLPSALVDTVGMGLRPSWSSDDRYLVYYNGGVQKLELATGRVSTLTRRTGCCRPSWRRPPPAPAP